MSDQRPSELELMQYADGELSDERAAQVQAYLARDPQAQALVDSIQALGAFVQTEANARTAQSQTYDVADWVMAQLEPAVPQKPENKPIGPAQVIAFPSTRRRKAALLGSAFAGLAAAAAIALLLGRVGGFRESVQSTVSSPLAQLSIPTNSSQPTASTSIAASEVEAEPGVSVDSVDFGARAGTIFYVPTETGTTTTVVWLSDEEGGGKP